MGALSYRKQEGSLQPARGTNHDRRMEKTLQHQTTIQCLGIPPTSPENHRPDGPKANRAQQSNWTTQLKLINTVLSLSYRSNFSECFHVYVHENARRPSGARSNSAQSLQDADHAWRIRWLSLRSLTSFTSSLWRADFQICMTRGYDTPISI